MTNQSDNAAEVVVAFAQEVNKEWGVEWCCVASSHADIPYSGYDGAADDMPAQGQDPNVYSVQR